MKLLIPLLLLLTACGDGVTTPTGPPDVRVVNSSLSSMGTQNGTTIYSLTATVENRGGAGFWRVQVWSQATPQQGQGTLLGTSNEYQLGGGTSQTVTWEVAPLEPALIVVQARSADTAEWRETHRHNIL